MERQREANGNRRYHDRFDMSQAFSGLIYSIEPDRVLVAVSYTSLKAGPHDVRFTAATVEDAESRIYEHHQDWLGLVEEAEPYRYSNPPAELLEGRTARCSCYTATAPSSLDLPFFRYRGPGSGKITHVLDSFYCGHAGWD